VRNQRATRRQQQEQFKRERGALENEHEREWPDYDD